MSDKKIGLFLGRFQPLHYGHCAVIDRMLKECDVCIVAVGSANKKKTEKNPLPFWLRRKMLKKIYKNRITIVGINDRPLISNEGWGEYVFAEVEKQTLLRPNRVYQGSDHAEDNWYAKMDGVETITIKREYDGPELTNTTGTSFRKLLLHMPFWAGWKDWRYLGIKELKWFFPLIKHYIGKRSLWDI